MASSELRPTFIYTQPWADDPGSLLDTSGGAWVYRVVPPSPCTDAATPADRARAAEPLMGALRELEALVPTRVARRFAARSSYREIHLLTCLLPGHYTPDPTRPDAAALAGEMGSVTTDRHQALLGVRLVSSSRRDTLSQTVRDLAEAIAYGGSGVEDYERDRETVSRLLARHGLGVPTAEQVRAATAWWSPSTTPAVIVYPDGDHLHLMRTMGAARAAERAVERRTECTEWGASLTGHRVMTMAAVTSVPTGVEATDPASLWISALHRGGALAVSVRASVEPAKVTRSEIRRHRREYVHDIAEAQAAGKLDKGEATERLERLSAAEDAYARGGPPTLHQLRVTVAMDGQWADVTTMDAHLPVTLEALAARQGELFMETQIGCPARENPYVKDWPAQVVACAGAGDVSVVGDSPAAPSVLWGFTEHDRQPAYFDPKRATDEDTSGFTLVAGATGSGKALDLGTRLLTPTGTVRMGEVQVGDTLYAIDGTPTTVTWAGPVNPHPDMFRLTLDTGQEVACDADHQWVVYDLDDPSAPPAASALGLARRLERWPAAFRPADPARLFDIVVAVGGTEHYTSADEVAAALRMSEATDATESEALAGLARRLRERVAGRVGEGAERLSVAEMLARGHRYAIPLAAPLPGAPLPACDGGALCAAERACEGQPVAERYMRARPRTRAAMVEAAARWCGWDGAEAHITLASTRRRTADQLVSLARSLGWWVSEPVCEGGEWLATVDTAAHAARIVSMVQAPSVPARCITVDHPTRTYLIEGCIPTSNTQLLLRHAQQLSRAGRAVVSFGPKPMADASPVVLASGGSVVDLSDLISADGILDPFSYATSMEMAVNLSASTILAANPWGTADARGRFEVDLMDALRVGAQAGAPTSGAALRTAWEAGAVSDEVYLKVARLAQTSPQFRAFVGSGAAPAALRGLTGWTHIQVGAMGLDLPNEREAADPASLNVSQRVSVTLVRSLITSLTYALRDKGGSILQDEAWVSMLAGASELDRSGRLCREFGVDIVMFNQKVSEAYNTGLAGYFRRGIILAQDDEKEAHAALRLFRDDLDTPERVARLTARATKGSGAGTVPNWESVRHLHDPETRQVLRGSVGYMIDLDGACVPVEIVLPPAFLELATTNAAVLRARREAGQ